jgi:PiT family inorganic phosphate transporter
VEPALVLVVLAAVVFAWTNGFHDASNAIATSLATGALTPRVAPALAAVLNVIGGLFGVSVAQTLQRSLLEVPVAQPGLGVVLAALVSAVAWNLATWWFGMPSSSSHALLGGMAGAGLIAGARVDWELMQQKVLLPTLASPLLGFFAAWLLSVVLLRATQDAAHGSTRRRFRLAQTVSASAMALGHGLQDAQKSAGAVMIALVVTSHVNPGDAVPLWVRVLVAGALGLGTAFGGWRIIRTLGRRIAPVEPVTGFAAETVAAAALYTASGVFAAPVSSTHVVVASIMGGGATHGLRAIRWTVVRRIAVVFVLTPFATAGVAALLYRLPLLSP